MSKKYAIRLLGRAKFEKFVLVSVPDDASREDLSQIASLIDGQVCGTELQQDPDDFSRLSPEVFSANSAFHDDAPVRFSVERSLQRLKVECLDIVLVHSDGNDLAIVEQHGTLQALAELKKEGKLKALGLSGKTVDGGLAALPDCDLMMITYNPVETDQAPLLDACADTGTGVLIKKALASGHLNQLGDNADPVETAMAFALDHPATTAAVVGTITPANLERNVAAARRAVGN